MSAPRWQRVKEVLADALMRPPDERPAFLDQACDSDAELRREVESLMGSYGEAGAFLSRGPTLDPAGAEAVPEHAEEARRIGPYRILGVIARGGMGTVYKAVRDDDAFQKTVALKLVRGGAAFEHVERRFRQERQILGRLQHPNIATILDGGATDDGQPYLVMEHVEGRPITVYCDEHGLGTRQRLALFGPVCAAVQYAHQNLVVHRDLKPDNILVTADGTPKLLDFGIAKLLAAGVDPDTAPTATMLPMMTPEYASPEQVKGEPVTTASDVYSLGVLLYEVLAGRRPYSIKADSMEEIVRAVCETNPPLPSTAARTRGGGEVTGPRTERSRSELKGDLDTIVMKALRKEPARRYGSVQDLWEDLRRHLDGLPVRARPDTLGYRARKFVGRHRGLVAATVVVILALAAGMAATVREKRIAERRFHDVRKLATFVMFDMHDAIVKLPGSTPARKQLVQHALQYLDGLAAESATDVTLRAEVAKGYHRLAVLQGVPSAPNLGDRVGALATVGKAAALQETVVAARPDDPDQIYELVTCYRDRLGLLLDLGRADEAWASPQMMMKKALESAPAALAGTKGIVLGWDVYFFSLAEKADFEGDLAKRSDAHRRELEQSEKWLAMAPDDPEAQRDVAVACKYYGDGLQRLKQWDAAGRQYQRALAIDRGLVAAEPSNVHRKLDLSNSLASVGSLLRDRGDLEAALDPYREAMRLREEVVSSDPENDFAFAALVRGHQSLAKVFALKGDLARVLDEEAQALRLRYAWEKKHPSAHGTAVWDARRDAAVGDHRTTMAAHAARAADRRDHLRGAREAYARALATWAGLGQTAPPLLPDEERESQRLREAIARCDQALAGPTAAGPRPAS